MLLKIPQAFQTCSGSLLSIAFQLNSRMLAHSQLHKGNKIAIVSLNPMKVASLEEHEMMVVEVAAVMACSVSVPP